MTDKDSPPEKRSLFVKVRAACANLRASFDLRWEHQAFKTALIGAFACIVLAFIAKRNVTDDWVGADLIFRTLGGVVAFMSSAEFLRNRSVNSPKTSLSEIYALCNLIIATAVLISLFLKITLV